MHPKFLPILCCPETGASLSLVDATFDRYGLVRAGKLVTPSGRAYPIIRGVPRFVAAEHYAGSFGFEWTRWPRVQFEDQNVGRPMAGHTTRMWERITGITGDRPDAVAGKTIVDFGCGPGRFLDIVRRKGGVAVGIDLSVAVDAARRNFRTDANVLIVQGDLSKPPFKPGSFDGGFTIGVLHHTPDPQAGLSALAASLKPGGWASCCVYPRGDFYDFKSVARFRRLHHLLKLLVGYRFAMGWSYFAAHVVAPLLIAARAAGWRKTTDYIERNWLVALRLKDVRWRILDVFDAITPDMASTHTSDEVLEWMKAVGLHEACITPWCPTSAFSHSPVLGEEGRGEGKNMSRFEMRTPNIEHRTPNIEGESAVCSSPIDVRSSEFDVRCSMFEAHAA